MHATADEVFVAMQRQAHAGPVLRCFPHRVGTLPAGADTDTRLLVDSCVVDVTVNGHLTYAYIDPVTTGPANSPKLIAASTIEFNAD